MLIDGTNLILGRLASFAAKQALLGEPIIITNCEKVVISGSRSFLLDHMRQKKERGGPYTGPFFQRMPDRFVRRAIRGMLPYKQERGRKAYDRIMCYLGIPEKYTTTPTTPVPGASATKLKTLHYIHVAEIARAYGKKI